MATWAPQEAGFLQICQILGELQTGKNQAQILKQLEQYRQYPDFNAYLAFVFAKADQVPLEIRQSAGLLLKNNLKTQYAATSPQLQAFIKDVLVSQLASPQRPLRTTAGSCISAVAVASGLGEWPELVAALVTCLGSSNAAGLDGALGTLYMIIEDSPIQMEVGVASAGGKSTSALLVPPLMLLLRSQVADVRRQAAACLNLMARDMPSGLIPNLDEYLQALFALAHDAVAAVRKEVVVGLVQLLSVQPDKLQPFLYQVVEYMLQSNEAEDEGVALESCEFWMAFCEARLEPELLRPFLPRLIPVLMKNMVFEDHDDEVQEAEEEEAAAARPERAQDLKPLHHKSAKEHGAHPGGLGPGDSEDGDDDDDDEAVSRWNLRKCSAAGLDRLSVVYGDELLPLLMPIVQQRLDGGDWRARESAILALGAVSEGCHAGLLPYLKGMVQMMLPSLRDPRPLVRVITCWSLSRYSYWLLAGAQEAANAGAHGAASGSGAGAGPSGTGAGESSAKESLGPVVQGLVEGVRDRNRFVQDAACSALATLCETVGQEDMDVMSPYIRPVVEILAWAISTYGRRNLRLACDAAQMLADAAGNYLSDPSLVAMLIVPLGQRLSTLQPQERELLPLLECCTSLSIVAGRHIDTFAPGLFEAALRIITFQLTARAQQAAAPPGTEVPHEYDRELHVCALDLVSGLAEALGPSIDPLVGPSGLMQVVASACCDEAADVRQSGFAIMGELCKGCVSHVAPRTQELVTAALNSLSAELLGRPRADGMGSVIKAANNACWAIGELAIKLPPTSVQPWAEPAAERLAGILAGLSRAPRGLADNAAITLGRLGMVCAAQLAPHLPHFCAQWCTALRNIRDDVEKEHAFTGLFALLRLNPGPAMPPGPGWAALAAAVASWRSVNPPALKSEMVQVMQLYKQSLSAQGAWQAALSALEPPLAQKLCSMCEL